MRRTADSLLILADAPTRAAGQDDLTVGDGAPGRDLRRAGLPARADRRRPRTARISDDAAADVVHLLTELVDNALSYSSPTTTVRAAADAPAPSGVTIEVIDSGLGIPERALAELNDDPARAAARSPPTPPAAWACSWSAGSRSGTGISVDARRNPEAGTTATVFLPSSILPGFDSPPAPAPKAPATPAEAPGLPGRVPTLRPVGSPTSVDPLPTRVPASVASADPNSADSIEARISGALGLPRRQPGSTVTPATAAPAPVAPAPVAPAAVAAPAVAPAAVPSVPAAAAAAVALSAPTAADLATARATSTEAPTETAAEAAPGAAPGTGQPADVIPIRAHQPADALDSASPFDDTDEPDTDTPIFRAMRSAWLTSDGGDQPWQTSEVEEGWNRADRVADATTEQRVTAAGLPARRPGSLLVPGGVTRPTVAARDPEAIRKRLAAHAAGVSRGRSAATTPHPEHTEAGPA